jgi:hypothetical protein
LSLLPVSPVGLVHTLLNKVLYILLHNFLSIWRGRFCPEGLRQPYY